MAVLGSECRWSHKGSVTVPPGGQGKTRPSLQRIPPAHLAPSLLAQLRHAASVGMRITESAPLGECRRSWWIPLFSQAQFLRKRHVRVQNPGQGPKCRVAEGSDLLLHGQLSRHYPLLPTPTAWPLFQTRQEWEGRVWEILCSVSLWILAAEQGGPRSVAGSTAIAPSSIDLLSGCLKPMGRRALSHLPCHDSSVNHLKPSFTRQGSVELIAH